MIHEKMETISPYHWHTYSNMEMQGRENQKPKGKIENKKKLRKG